MGVHFSEKQTRQGAEPGDRVYSEVFPVTGKQRRLPGEATIGYSDSSVDTVIPFGFGASGIPGLVPLPQRHQPHDSGGEGPQRCRKRHR